LIASYGYKARKAVSNRFKFGESLVGQAALEKSPILLSEAPTDYIKISSGLGEAAPVNIIVLPILLEEQVLGVIELASLSSYSNSRRSSRTPTRSWRRRPGCRTSRTPATR